MATTSSLTVVENKVSTVSNFVKKKQKKKKKTNKQTNKQTITQKLLKLKRKLLIKVMINISLLQNLISLWQNFWFKIKRRNLTSKSDIANFVNKADFDNELKDCSPDKNELNELSKKVTAISTEDLIDKFSILNGAKCFS